MNEEWTLSIAKNVKGIKDKLGKGVNEVRKEKSLRLSYVRNSKEEELTREYDTAGFPAMWVFPETKGLT